MKNQANMPAAHSTAMILAVATLFRRNSDSGISGARTRASISRNSDSNATAAPSFHSVAGALQPASLPLMMAYTASIKEAVTVTAPPRSR